MKKILKNNKNPFLGAWSIHDPISLQAKKEAIEEKTDIAMFCKSYKKWIGEGRNFLGWDRFEYLDFSNGTTEVFDKFYQLHSNRRLRLLHGEYFYHQIQSKIIFKKFAWLEDEKLSDQDVVVLSCPFSDTGNLTPGLDNILSECDRLSIPVMIDMAYISISDIDNINLDYDCIECITSSLSKIFPVENDRIGIRLRQKFSDDTLFAYNKNQYINWKSLSIGNHLIKVFSNNWLIERYRDKQNNLCKELDISPSRSVIFGIDYKNNFLEYNRGTNSNRLCFSRVWDGRIVLD